VSFGDFISKLAVKNEEKKMMMMTYTIIFSLSLEAG
jgi:hypothetical protein